MRPPLPGPGAATRSSRFSTDPGTLFATWPARIENIESGHCSSYWEREFLVDDANLFAELSRRPTPVASLQQATDGLVERSARYREFMRPQYFQDELRAALRSGESTWGLLLLLRHEGQEAFNERSRERVDGAAALPGAPVRDGQASRTR